MIKTRPPIALTAALALMMITAGAVQAAAGAEDLAKKYAPILGDYEFDLTEQGMGVMIINVYVEEDSIYAWPETSNEPARMEPVEGETFVFQIEDPDEGTYRVSFMKDEAGQYSKCRVANEAMGMDVTGEKVKK